MRHQNFQSAEITIFLTIMGFFFFLNLDSISMLSSFGCLIDTSNLTHEDHFPASSSAHKPASPLVFCLGHGHLHSCHCLAKNLGVIWDSCLSHFISNLPAHPFSLIFKMYSESTHFSLAPPLPIWSEPTYSFLRVCSKLFTGPLYFFIFPLYSLLSTQQVEWFF